MAKVHSELTATKTQKRRDKIVRLLTEGKSQPEVAKLAKCSQATVSRTWKAHREELAQAEAVHGAHEREPLAREAQGPIPRELGQDPVNLAAAVRRAKSEEIAALIEMMPAEAVSRAAGFAVAVRELFALMTDKDVPARVRLDAVKFYFTNGPERVRWGNERLFMMSHPMGAPATAAGSLSPDGEGDGMADAMMLIGSADGRQIYGVEAVQPDAGA